MHSHSFQDSELKLHMVRQRLPETVRGEVDDSTGSSKGVRNKGLITQKRIFDVHSHGFQDTDLKHHNFIIHLSTKQRVYIYIYS